MVALDEADIFFVKRSSLLQRTDIISHPFVPANVRIIFLEILSLVRQSPTVCETTTFDAMPIDVMTLIARHLDR